MRIKVYLNPGRDLELIAIRYNPALDFCGIAREVLRSHVRNGNYKFPLLKTKNYVKKSMTCYISLDDEEDADVISYLGKTVLSNSALVRNIMLRSIENDTRFIYVDENLKTSILSYEYERKQKAKRQILKKRLEQKNSQ